MTKRNVPIISVKPSIFLDIAFTALVNFLVSCTCWAVLRLPSALSLVSVFTSVFSSLTFWFSFVSTVATGIWGLMGFDMLEKRLSNLLDTSARFLFVETCCFTWANIASGIDMGPIFLIFASLAAMAAPISARRSCNVNSGEGADVDAAGAFVSL